MHAPYLLLFEGLIQLFDFDKLALHKFILVLILIVQLPSFLILLKLPSTKIKAILLLIYLL